MALGRNVADEAKGKLRVLQAEILGFESTVTNLNNIFSSNEDYQKFSKETAYGARLDAALQEIIQICQYDITNELKDLKDSTGVMLDRQAENGE